MKLQTLCAACMLRLSAPGTRRRVQCLDTCFVYAVCGPAGNHDDYWRVLWDNGKITKERLETMHNPIKGGQQAAPCLLMYCTACVLTAAC
jgi:hypothetical protein